MARVKITQERSKIRCLDKHKRTLAALGLRRINHSVTHEDTPQIRGMIHQVRYLVRVEPADGGETKRARARGEKGRTS
jgi:large subunit ribosomal protein L30